MKYPICIHREMAEKTMMDALTELRCHFTWDLLRVDNIDLPDLENRIQDEIEFLDTKFNSAIYNTLAYVKYVRGQSEEALESLRKAEELILQHHGDKAEIKSFVTWGNYAWIHYHMGELPKVQFYLDKVETSCKRLLSPFRYKVELPEIDCEKGWALLKFGKEYYEEAKVCFQKALESKPDDPEFNTGFAISVFRLDLQEEYDRNISLKPLRKAVRLNPEDAYLKVLLALKLQSFHQDEEGEKYLKDALISKTSQPYILRYAAKFYCRKGYPDEAIDLLQAALERTPTSNVLHDQMGFCYEAKVNQIKKATNYKPRGRDRQDLERAIQLAIFHFKKSIEIRPTFELSYLKLGDMYAEAGDYDKAKESYLEVLNLKEIQDKTRQEVYFHLGRFNEFHKRSEADALAHYLEALKIGKGKSLMGKRLPNAVEKLAKKRLHRNKSDVESLSLLGFIHKMKGETEKALELYEAALELGSFPSASWNTSLP
ncbi:interferon-induced protein with tetratricopeptide repeats 1B-like [Gracilinanus agilis]|uniref:interferon-induced protein with tetratricopeptide repeats 1B-like n=1 Tax=Gracilinanus agilis TaxID=191870 RepID=UPI001CFF163C|nr:interferon-induced protein with tetratricopeptide repeats 1B-like [Gracilinanus agilis]